MGTFGDYNKTHASQKTKQMAEKATARKISGRKKAAARKAARKAERAAAKAANPSPRIATGHRNLLLSHGKKTPCFNYFWMSMTKNDIKEFLKEHKDSLDEATLSKFDKYADDDAVKTNEWRDLAFPTFEKIFPQANGKSDGIASEKNKENDEEIVGEKVGLSPDDNMDGKPMTDS